MAQQNPYVLFPTIKESQLSQNLQKKAKQQRNQSLDSDEDNLQGSVDNKKQNKNTNQQGLGLGMSLNTNQPVFVSSRKEINQQSKFPKEEKIKKKTDHDNGIDNILSHVFPMHREKDYVEEHSQGFKNKKNIDLFKHYFRLYLKNKFKIKQSKKDIVLLKQNYKEVIKNYQEDAILKQKKAQEIYAQQKKQFGNKDPNDTAIQHNIKSIKEIQELMKKQSKVPTGFELYSDKNPSFKLQEFIVQKNMNDIDLYKRLIQLYEDNNVPSTSGQGNKQITRQNLSPDSQLATNSNFYNNKLQNNNLQNNLQQNQDQFSQGQGPKTIPDDQSIYQIVEQKMQQKMNAFNNTQIQNLNTQATFYDEKYEQSYIDIHMVEEIFINQIINFIKKFGVMSISKRDYLEFKRIVEDRSQKLTVIQKYMELEKLVIIKKNNNQRMNRMKTFKSMDGLDSDNEDLDQKSNKKSSRRQHSKEDNDSLLSTKKPGFMSFDKLDKQLMRESDKRFYESQKSSEGQGFTSGQTTQYSKLVQNQLNSYNLLAGQSDGFQDQDENKLRNQQDISKIQENAELDSKQQSNNSTQRQKTTTERQLSEKQKTESSKSKRKTTTRGKSQESQQQEDQQEILDIQEVQSPGQEAPNLIGLDTRPSDTLYENSKQKQDFKKFIKQFYNYLHKDSKMELMELIIQDEINKLDQELEKKYEDNLKRQQAHKRRKGKLEKAQEARKILKQIKKDFPQRVQEAKGVFDMLLLENLKDCFKNIAFDEVMIDDIKFIIKTNMHSGDVQDILTFLVERGIKNIRKQLNILGIKDPQQNMNKYLKIKRKIQKNDGLIKIKLPDEQEIGSPTINSSNDLGSNQSINLTQFQDLSEDQKLEIAEKRKQYEKKRQEELEKIFGKKKEGTSIMGSSGNFLTVEQQKKPRLSFTYFTKQELEQTAITKTSIEFEFDDEEDIKLKEEQLKLKKRYKKIKEQYQQKSYSSDEDENNTDRPKISSLALILDKKTDENSEPAGSRSDRKITDGSPSQKLQYQQSVFRLKQQRRKDVLDKIDDSILTADEKKKHKDLLSQGSRTNKSKGGDIYNFSEAVDEITADQEIRAKHIIKKQEDQKIKKMKMDSSAINMSAHSQDDDDDEEAKMMRELLEEGKSMNDSFFQRQATGAKNSRGKKIKDSQFKNQVSGHLKDLKDGDLENGNLFQHVNGKKTKRIRKKVKNDKGEYESVSADETQEDDDYFYEYEDVEEIDNNGNKVMVRKKKAIMKTNSVNFKGKSKIPKPKRYILADGTISATYQEGAVEAEELDDDCFYDENNNIVKKDKDGKVVIVKKANQIISKQAQEKKLIESGNLVIKKVKVKRKNSKGEMVEVEIEVKEYYEDVEIEVEEDILDENGKVIGKKKVKKIVKKKKHVVEDGGSKQSLDEQGNIKPKIKGKKKKIEFKAKGGVFIPTSKKQKDKLNKLHKEQEALLEEELRQIERDTKTPRQSEYVNINMIKGDDKEELKKMMREELLKQGITDEKEIEAKLNQMIDDYENLSDEKKADIQKKIAVIKKKNRAKKEHQKKQIEALKNNTDLTEEEKQYLINAIEGGEAFKAQQQAEQEFETYMKKNNVKVDENGEYYEEVQPTPTTIKPMPSVPKKIEIKEEVKETTKKQQPGLKTPANKQPQAGTKAASKGKTGKKGKDGKPGTKTQAQKEQEEKKMKEYAEKLFNMSDEDKKIFFNNLSAEEKKKVREFTDQLEKQEQERARNSFLNDLDIFRQTNQKTELRKIMARNLSIKQLKELIRQLIDRIGKNGDPESINNIHLYQERQIQLKDLLSNLVTKQEMQIIGQDRVEFQFEELMESKKVKHGMNNKKPKYWQEVFIPEKQAQGIYNDIQGKQLDQSQLDQILKMQDMNKDIASILDRLKLFQLDTLFLQSIRDYLLISEDSVVKQISINKHPKKRAQKHHIMKPIEMKNFADLTPEEKAQLDPEHKDYKPFPSKKDTDSSYTHDFEEFNNSSYYYTSGEDFENLPQDNNNEEVFSPLQQQNEQQQRKQKQRKQKRDLSKPDSIKQDTNYINLQINPQNGVKENANINQTQDSTFDSLQFENIKKKLLKIKQNNPQHYKDIKHTSQNISKDGNANILQYLNYTISNNQKWTLNNTNQVNSQIQDSITQNQNIDEMVASIQKKKKQITNIPKIDQSLNLMMLSNPNNPEFQKQAQVQNVYYMNTKHFNGFRENTEQQQQKQQQQKQQQQQHYQSNSKQDIYGLNNKLYQQSFQKQRYMSHRSQSQTVQLQSFQNTNTGFNSNSNKNLHQQTTSNNFYNTKQDKFRNTTTKINYFPKVQQIDPRKTYSQSFLNKKLKVY